VQNWGSDIFLFGQQPEHKRTITHILECADYYGCETKRDRELAKGYGFNGEMFPLVPNTGGFDLDWCAEHNSIKTTQRKVILLKGLHGWAGRALTGMKAIEICARLIKDKGYQVIIYSAMFNLKVIKEEAKRITKATGVTFAILPYIPWAEMLSIYSKARVYLGLSISDAIPTSLLEAMAMGAFPIQSNTGAAHDWTEHGKSGLIVSPEDTEEVTQCLRLALLDDKLVDKAREINWQTAKNRLDGKVIAQQVVKAYHEIGA
jgi:glycosyltransferase involved in cell wall biosynthesis